MYDIENMMKARKDSPLVLVSYPRTGSHWVRYVVELYTGIPCAPRAFIHDKPASVWGVHVHDRFCTDVLYDNVLYLHRNPVDTIFSQVRYLHGPRYNDDDVGKIKKEYSNHLAKYMGSAKLKASYDDLKACPITGFSDVLHFIGVQVVDEELLKHALETTTKNEIRRVSESYDTKVLVCGDRYEEERVLFYKRYKAEIESTT